MSTYGPSYESRFDGKRLHGKQDKVRVYMLSTNGHFQTLDEIRNRLEAHHEERFPSPSLSAFLRHLRKRQFGSYVLEKRRRNTAAYGLWEYRLLPPKPSVPVQDLLFAEAIHA